MYVLKIIVVLVVLSPLSAMSQVITGIAPLGGTVVTLGINMSNNTNGTSQTQGLDLDCDGFDDVEIDLQMGNLSLTFPTLSC